jgi:hypothetical protein
MSDTFNTTPANWQGIDDEPTAGSKNLVKSGGVFDCKSIVRITIFDSTNIIDRLTEGQYGYNTSTGYLYYKGAGSSQYLVPKTPHALYLYNNIIYRLDESTNELTRYFNIDDFDKLYAEFGVSQDFAVGATNIPFEMENGKYYLFYNNEDFPVSIYARTSADSSNITIKSNLAAKSYYLHKATETTSFLRIGSGTVMTVGISAWDNESVVTGVYKANYLIDDIPEAILLSYIAGGGVTGYLNVGEYGYNTVTKIVYYKDTASTYKEIMPTSDVIYRYKTSYYKWDGSNLVTTHFTEFDPKVTFEIGHTFKDISAEFANFDLSEQGRTLILEQVYKLFDALAMAYPELITKYDPMASSATAATSSSPAISPLTDILTAMTTAGYSDYPFYAKGIDTAVERTFTYPSGQTITKIYDVTPAYKTYIYRINYNNVNVNRERATKFVMLLTGGVHPNEKVQPFNLYLIAKQLCEGEDVELFKLACIFDIWIMPCVCGYGQYHDTRYNANGVNLNRNFDIDWEQGIAGENYGGPYAGSEFETQLLMETYNYLKPSAMSDCHNYSNLNGQFYTITKNQSLTDNAYKSLIDCSKTFINELPAYFGTNIRLFIDAVFGDGHAPMRVSNYKGAWDDWCDKQGAVGAETIEVSQCINYHGGQLSPGYESWTLNVFKVAEYTLRIQILRLAEFCLRHKPTVITY